MIVCAINIISGLRNSQSLSTEHSLFTYSAPCLRIVIHFVNVL